MELSIKNPTFSILLPVYNGEEFLSKLLSSIDLQTYKNFEVLICDDASRDKSYDYLMRWKKNTKLSVSIERHKENKGVNQTQLNNLRRSKGHYIVMAAQDHIWHSNRLAELSKLIKNNKVSLLFSGYSQFKVNGSKTTVIPGACILGVSQNLIAVFRSDLFAFDTMVLHNSLLKNYEKYKQFNPIDDLALALDACSMIKEKNLKWASYNSPLISKRVNKKSISISEAPTVNKMTKYYVSLNYFSTILSGCILGSSLLISKLRLSTFSNLKDPSLLRVELVILGTITLLARFSVSKLAYLLVSLNIKSKYTVGKVKKESFKIKTN